MLIFKVGIIILAHQLLFIVILEFTKYFNFLYFIFL